jgi:hypothetical protein
VLSVVSVIHAFQLSFEALKFLPLCFCFKTSERILLHLRGYK